MVDYSKWKDIEISDDEDDTHPNIDTPSLFRWRHQARLERMEEAQKEREEVQAKKKEYSDKLKELEEKLKNNDGNVDELKQKIEKLQIEFDEFKKKEQEIQKKEKKTPWNVDTISKPGFQKTVINNNFKKRTEIELSEEEKEKKLKEFIKQNEKTMKTYGMLKKYDDSKRFLTEHPHLVSDDTANYLVIWCIDLEMEEKHDLMEHVAHQCICMQYMLELSKQLDVDPRACINSFFTKIQNAAVEYRTQFEKEIADFIKRIKRRAQEKLEEAIAEQEEKEKQERLGPGGLDPVEVYESLPEELQKCFDTRDVQLLQEVIAKLPIEDAKYHMKRCVDSGLWVPESGNQNLSD